MIILKVAKGELKESLSQRENKNNLLSIFADEFLFYYSKPC
jgi:hypothetical protein